jgi:hypothetical protein
MLDEIGPLPFEEFSTGLTTGMNKYSPFIHDPSPNPVHWASSWGHFLTGEREDHINHQFEQKSLSCSSLGLNMMFTACLPQHSQNPTRGSQIGPKNLENNPVVQRNEQRDFGFSVMFNYEVIQVYI